MTGTWIIEPISKTESKYSLSLWRNHFSVDELSDYLQLKSNELIDVVSVASFNVTPNIPLKSRYLEIKKYCLNHGIDMTGADKTQHIVILDDVEDLFTDEHGACNSYM